MEKLYSPQDIAEIFGVSMNSAYRYIKKMPHIDDPCLRVRESVLTDYLEAHEVIPEGKRWNKPVNKLPYR